MHSDDKLDSLAADYTRRLLVSGFCHVPGLLPAEQVEALDRDLAGDFAATPFCRGSFYGERTQRFGRVLARSRRSASLVQHPLVLKIVDRVLRPWCDSIQLNLTQAIAIHPGAFPQMPHRDQDMWRGEVGRIEYLVNVMWPFTRYTPENGSTFIWPGSHGANALRPDAPSSRISLTVEPGSAVLILGSTLHAAGGNRSSEIRRGMIAGYSLGWLKPYENQWLAYPPEIARTFPRELAALVGYRQHRPNLGNYEGECPSILLRDEVPDRIAAVDALRPEQEQAVRAFEAEQRAAGALR